MTDARPVLVGYDGSPDAEHAVRWAARLGQPQRRRLHVCIARGDLYTVSRWADEWTRGLAEEWREKVQGLLTDLGVPGAEVEIADGLPAPVLIDRSAAAYAVVLGSRGHGRLVGAVMGSVSQHCARHARAPVVIARVPADREARVALVGVDGSPESLTALDFCTEVASTLDLEVRAVYCRQRPAIAGHDIDPEALERVDGELAHRRHQVESALEEAGRRHPSVKVALAQTREGPVRALVDASERAALVVVGRRGHGAFAEMVLGSVSSAVLAHAHCPVAVSR